MSIELWAFVLAGILIIVIGAYYAINSDLLSITEINIPHFGKIKTSVPAIALIVLGLVPIFFAYKLKAAEDQENRAAETKVTFHGQVAIDPASIGGIDAITVGVTSGLWSQTQTPDAASPTLDVTIPVPDTWPTYTAYAFALGGPKTRPAIIGTSLDNPNFKLRIGP